MKGSRKPDSFVSKYNMTGKYFVNNVLDVLILAKQDWLYEYKLQFSCKPSWISVCGVFNIVYYENEGDHWKYKKIEQYCRLGNTISLRPSLTHVHIVITSKSNFLIFSVRIP